MKKRLMLLTALGAATMFTASAQADVCGSGLTLPANVWTMFSAPCAPPSGSESVSTQFTADLGDGVYGTDWIMFKWNAATGAYEQLAAGDPLEQDTGYWIFSTTDGTLKIDNGTHTTGDMKTTGIDDGYYGDCAQFGWSGKPCYKIDLAVPTAAEGTKWNLVGYPFVRSTKWADVVVAKSTDGGTSWSTVGNPSYADMEGYISKTGYVFNDSGSTYNAFDDSGSSPSDNTLLPNKSYWFQSRHVDGVSNIALLIPAPTYTVFVTSTTHTGNLGGTLGADGICSDRATEGGLTGTFKAWLATTDEQALQRIDPAGPITNTIGQLVSSAFGNMIVKNGEMLNPIEYDQSGSQIPTDDAVWSGTYYDGTTNGGQDKRCNDWQSWLSDGVCVGDIFILECRRETVVFQWRACIRLGSQGMCR